MKNRNKIKLDPGTRALRIISYVFVSIWALICLLPFILVISASFSTESIVAKEGFGLLPKGFTLSAYELVFRSPKMILGSYGVTIALTVCGTVVGLFIIAMTGYALQRKDFPFRNALSFFIYFTTLFSAGMAPTYIWVSRYLKLNGSYMAVFFQCFVVVQILFFSVGRHCLVKRRHRDIDMSLVDQLRHETVEQCQQQR